VIDEKFKIKFASTKRSPTDNESITTRECECGRLVKETRLTVGLYLSEQTLEGHIHPVSIVQTEEQPSPFKVLPSSHRSVMIILSPQ
jgi:hypothetical protein